MAAAALRWAAGDSWERWVNAANGRTPLEDTIQEYLICHDPFPAESEVEVLASGDWAPAVVVERTGVDEWLVELGDGAQAWRDHHELRPFATD